jgi:hypothetical protein
MPLSEAANPKPVRWRAPAKRAPCPHARVRQNVPLGKKSPTLTGAVFVLTPQALELLQENVLVYGGCTSGGIYIQFDPIGLNGGPNGYLYAGANPLSFIDPMGLTQADINAAVNAARAMQPNWRFPSDVKTWSQQGKGGKNNFWDKNIYIDSKYLECLDDGEAGALLGTILHELTHFNQTWYQFGIDNIRERVTGGNSSNAQDTADALLWKNDKILADYLKNRHVDKNSCQCRK